MRRSVWLFACGTLAIIGLFAPEVSAGLPVKLFRDEKDIAGVSSGPARAAAQALEDNRLLSPENVEAFLRGVAVWRGDTQAWQVYLTYSDMVVPYLEARQPSVLASLRLFASGAVKGKALVALLRAAAVKLNPEDFMQWITDFSSASHFDAPLSHLTPEQLRTASAGPPPGRTRDAMGRAAGPDLRNPKVQIVEFAARLKTFNQTLGFARANGKSVRREPRVPSKRANLNVGLQSFKARKIGIVVHVFQFQDEYGYLYPPGAYMNGTGRARNLVDNMNKYFRYSGTNIQFYLKQYRADTKKYPYLNLRTVEAWQACAGRTMDCTCAYAKKYGVANDRFLNIFVLGAAHQYEGWGTLGAVAASSIIPPLFDACGMLGFYDTSAARPYQHVWAQWEIFDTLKYNSWKWSQFGGNAIAHEVGHFLGLLHTHDDRPSPDCATTDDGIYDTPAELNESNQGKKYLTAAATLCRRMVRTGVVTAKDVAAMSQFDSCPKQRYMDNLFNIMAYTPSASCSLYFTRGQITKMQWVLSKSQSHLGK